MTKRVPFVQADVFTDRPFGGNQLAVFTDGRGLSSEEMQALTQEMNYSESTFVLPPEIPGAVKRVRIFTPGGELPMAGHPTVGTAFVLARKGEIELQGDTTQATLQLGIGPVTVWIAGQNSEPDFVWMAHRQPEFSLIRTDRDRVAQALGLSAEDLVEHLPLQVVSTGVPFLIVPLCSLDAARRARSNEAALRGLFDSAQPIMLELFTTETMSPTVYVHVRMFAPHVARISEDPATGAAAAPLGAYLARYGLLTNRPETRFVIEQGIEMGRPSQIQVEVRRQGAEITGLRIGGKVVVVGEGEIFWD